jgi:MFS family permease
MIRSLGKPTSLFFIVNALACIGLNIGVVGVNWFIIDATRQNSVLGAYGAVSVISAFVTLALSGHFTDKYNKIDILKYCCIGQAVLFFIVGLAHALQMRAGYIIALLALLNMPLMVIFSIVSRGAVAHVWDKQNLARGNALLEVTLQLGAMCAALLTGLLYGRFGFSVLIALGGVVTLCAGGVLLVCPLKIDFPAAVRESYWSGLRKGLIYLVRHRAVFLYGLVAFVPTIVISVSNNVIPGYVEQTLKAGAGVYGAGDICFALGALLAGWWASRKSVPYTKLKAFIYFGLSMGCMLVLMLSARVWIFYMGVFLVGVVLAQLRIGLNTLFMDVADKEYLGRSLSLLMALAMGVQAVMAYVIGKLMDAFGAPTGFAVLVGMLAVGGVLLLWGRKEKDF